LLWLLARQLGIWYLGASVVSYSVCIAYNFALQRVWAFNSTGRSILKQLPQFVGVNLLGLMLNTVVLYILVESTELPLILCQAVSSLAICGLSFMAYRRIFFRPPPQAATVLSAGGTRHLIHAGKRVRSDASSFSDAMPRHRSNGKHAIVLYIYGQCEDRPH
jgi:putative flippase GtrA